MQCSCLVVYMRLPLINKTSSVVLMALLFNLLVNVLSCADVFECKQGENSTEVVNILVNMVKIFILFPNYNFKNDLPLNFASVCALAPGMALVVEH